MGFLSASYKQQIEDEDKKRNVSSSKPAPASSTSSKAKSVLGSVARAVGGSTARAVNQVYQEGKQIANTGKMEVASATDNTEAFRNANEQSKKDYKGFKSTGGLFNAGTITNEAETQKGDLITGARKIGADTVGVATEVVPFARGATLAKSGGKLLPNLARAGIEGAAYGAVGSAAEQFGDEGNVDLGETAKSALLGGATGGIGFGAGKAIERGLGKTASQAVDKPIIDYPNQELDQFLPTKIPVTGGDSEALVGKVANGVPTTGQSTFTPADHVEHTDADFRYRFNRPIKQVVKNTPVIADQYLKTGSKDSTNLLLSHLTKDNSSIGVRKIVDKLIPDITPKESKALSAQIIGTTDKSTVKDLLYTASENTRNRLAVGEKTVTPSKNISFADRQAKKFTNALTSDGGDTVSTSGDISDGLDAEGNYTSGPLKGQPPLTTSSSGEPVVYERDFNTGEQVPKTQSDLIDQLTELRATPLEERSVTHATRIKDTEQGLRLLKEKANLNTTTPKDARDTIALEATASSPSISAPAPKRAQAALVGEKNPSISSDTPTTQVGEGAQKQASKLEVLDREIQESNPDIVLPEQLKKVLSGDAAVKKAYKWDWLSHFEDTMTAAGRFFGRVGTDAVYKLAEGAKRYGDLQSAVRDDIVGAQKTLKKVAKTKEGRAEVQSRIYSALEDRDNVDIYLKSDKEKKIFEHLVNILDFWKAQRIKEGKAVVGENYSPRAMIQDALDSPSKLFESALTNFSADVKSRFSKERVKTFNDEDINRNIVDMIAGYSSSQAKESAYTGAIEHLKNTLPNVDPAFKTDKKSYAQGEAYLAKLLSQTLEPPIATGFAKWQNKLIGNTYGATLSFSPKLALQNLTQKFYASAVVSKKAVKLSRQMDKADIDDLRKDINTGTNPINDEAISPEGADKAKGGLSKIEPFRFTETHNTNDAFDKGVAQAVIDSPVYKEAVAKGAKPKEASKLALQDPDTRQLAIQRGNSVVNKTQFGSNFVLKPEYFREQGSFGFISKQWFKQFQRFPMGMIQNLHDVFKANDARAFDILRGGDPSKVKIVNYYRATQAMQNQLDDYVKAVKRGEVPDTSLEVANGYKKAVDDNVKRLEKEIKKNSEVRGHKTLAAYGRMWAAASALQFLFDGGSDPGRAAEYGAPINLSNPQNYLLGQAPSIPVRPDGTLKPDKLLNFVPGVGLAYNRGKDISRFVSGLTGDSSQ